MKLNILTESDFKNNLVILDFIYSNFNDKKSWAEDYKKGPIASKLVDLFNLNDDALLTIFDVLYSKPSENYRSNEIIQFIIDSLETGKTLKFADDTLFQHDFLFRTEDFKEGIRKKIDEKLKDHPNMKCIKKSRFAKVIIFYVWAE